ncbi:Uu.00g030890.m01.CDS01 [Anthostomella pinea]|uniref:Uu.00g030890.m01.CDS01 n=1 Tax=Anthostomella pinea TaxID=933095 RepID=A0AAI8YCY1_9PEZI|nr:Uu.00g030890.m01.CDS01 [Anthostomella pinea]
MSVNMRSYLPPPYNGKDHAVQVYVTGVTPVVDRDSTLQQKTEQLTAYYKGWYSERFVQAMRVTTDKHFNAMFKGRREGGAPPKPPSNVTLSSMGVVEKYLAGECGGGAVKVTDFRFGVSMMTRQMLLHVWTFQGRLCLSVNYNEAYQEASSA